MCCGTKPYDTLDAALQHLADRVAHGKSNPFSVLCPKTVVGTPSQLYALLVSAYTLSSMH